MALFMSSSVTSILIGTAFVAALARGSSPGRTEQWQIQRWITRIPRHIQKILELEGGKEYGEGQFDEVTHHKGPTLEELQYTGPVSPGIHPQNLTETSDSTDPGETTSSWGSRLDAEHDTG